MAYAGDLLYKECIRKKMGVLATKVKAREIVAHLPCLSDSDREEIEAKRELAGNYNAMMLLLDNLRRRMNWPEEFISALRICEQPALASDISEAYDRIREIHTQRRPPAIATIPVDSATLDPAAPPSSAPAPAAVALITDPPPAGSSVTVTRATVHNVPQSTAPLLTPTVEALPQQVTLPPMNSPPDLISSIAAPGLTDAPASVLAPDSLVQPPPESNLPAQLLLSVVAPNASSTSPGSASTLSPPIGKCEAPIGSRETESKVSEAVIYRSRSMKNPVQDTNPPGAFILSQDTENNPTVNQVVDSVHTAALPNCQETSQGTAQAMPSASTFCAAGYSSNFAAENEVNFSKPGVLIGEELIEEEPFSVSSDCLQISHRTMERSPKPARPQDVPNPNMAEEPDDETVSVTTDDLMISSPTITVTSQNVSVPIVSVHNSTTQALENSLTECNSYPHQPVENHYESFFQSFQTEPGTRMHILEVSEEPSVQNLNYQTPSMIGSSTVGLQPSGETESLNQKLESDDLGQNNITRSDQREESQGVLHQFKSNLPFVAAAAIGITAVFVALRHRY